MNRNPAHRMRPATCGLVMLVGLLATATHGQPPAAPAPEDWRLFEASQDMMDYRTRLRDGTLEESDKAFLTTKALQQLSLPKNRAMIDRIRRRMREVLCGEQASDPKAAATVNAVVTDFMTALARDSKPEMVVRVNAALMVGELRGPDAKPWPPAAAPLIAMLGDESLPPAVRIAAAAGVARHVEADPAARAADVGPTLLAIASAPLAGVDAVAADWLRSRAFVLLARLGTAAPGGTSAAAAKVLTDQSRSVDLRVRAAAALGRCIKAAGDTDVAAAVPAIGSLAAGALTSTKSEIERRELAGRLVVAAGGAQQQPQAPLAGDIDVGPSEVYRRDAWRLATLANALAPADGDGGLARVAGADAAAANALAGALRDGAGRLNATPSVDSLDAALVGLAGATNAPAGGASGPAGER